jgi:hypothetical protein
MRPPGTSCCGGPARGGCFSRGWCSLLLLLAWRLKQESKTICAAAAAPAAAPAARLRPSSPHLICTTPLYRCVGGAVLPAGAAARPWVSVRLDAHGPRICGNEEPAGGNRHAPPAPPAPPCPRRGALASWHGAQRPPAQRTAVPGVRGARIRPAPVPRRPGARRRHRRCHPSGSLARPDVYCPPCPAPLACRGVPPSGGRESTRLPRLVRPGPGV